jgi:hypothetical protein
MSLHSKYLPVFDFNEIHQIRVKASRERIFASAQNLDFAKSRLINFLFFLRGIPASDVQGISSLQKMGFTVLEIIPQEEIIFGLVGQFWKPSGNIQMLSVDEFLTFKEKDFLKATWNFKIVPATSNQYEVVTETRIASHGDTAKKKFSLYWFFIKPFSGLIRMEMLRAIRTAAENRL